MINITNFANDLFNKTTESGLQQMGEVFLPSVLIVWLIVLTLTIVLALFTLNKWKKFFLLFVLPQLVFLVLIILVFKFPFLPRLTADWFIGWLG